MKEYTEYWDCRLEGKNIASAMAQNSSDHSMSDEAAPIPNLALQAIIRPALKQVGNISSHNCC